MDLETEAGIEAAERPSAEPPGRRSVLLGNAPEGLDAKWLGERLAATGGAILHIARDQPRMALLTRLVRFFAPQVEIIALPAWDCLPYDRISPNGQVMAERLAALGKLLDEAKRPRLIVTSVNAVLQRLPASQVVLSGAFAIRAGSRLDRERLLAYLERNGYRRASAVVEAGEYAVRGGLLDIFPAGAPVPVRLDLFGTMLESIRTFDALSQRSLGKVSALTLQPVSEVMLDEAAAARFKAGFLQLFGSVTQDPLLEAVEAGRNVAGLEHWLPLFHERLVTIFDYLPEACEVTFDHLAVDAAAARAALIGEHYEARRQPAVASASFGAAPYRPLPPDMLYLDEQSFRQRCEARPCYQFSIFAPPPVRPTNVGKMRDLGGAPGRDFARERADRSVNLFDAIVAYLKELVQAGRKPLLAAHSEGTAERLRQVLIDHGFDTLESVGTWAEARRIAVAGLAVLPVEHGFTAPGIDLLAERDLLGERFGTGQKRARRADKFIADLAALSPGDHVVHAEHGIARFDGLITLEVGGAPHDCLKLLYAGGDKLFVPVESLEILSRYGNAEQEVQLDKLGGAGWQARKAKVKQRIKELAEELIKIAAERQTRHGQELGLPPGVYDEFAARFPFEETEDQLRAIEAVLEDLGSGKPMDRLICGDVGFGKTEVALRAAFVAAMSGKQVALLAPTTLLARQHFNVFQNRLEGLPIRIGHLSRFVPPKEAREVKKGAAEGQIDILIGTHALLAKDVSFKTLGLVIIDEEQHFGVAHKERLKRMRAEVHVLTMTATPIPRTLHMALGGMKELSIIATPPVDRLAVRSFIMPADPVVLREAIMREYYRGGQCFYVCPRISDQPRLRQDLEKLVPELKMAVANGQLPARELEQVMGDFYDRKTDLLIATNIIESGLDIPTANTLIVHRADQFGLAQLYQLRGRVGRSNVRGYAYFTVPANKVVQDAAEKRLHVIQSLDSLGAGFQLASHDLDIRGAGNLLGDEQSGQIREVGFELYNQMLEEAVTALRAEQAKAAAPEDHDWTPQITVDAAALMPDSFIGDLDLRLSMYRRLASLETATELEGFAAELIDRFGKLPQETEQLLQIVAIKQLCKQANVAKLDAGPKGVVVAFRQNQFKKPDRLVRLIADSRGQMRVRPDHRLVVLRETVSPTDRLRTARKLVSELAALAA